MIAIAAKLKRSQRDDRDGGAISGAGLRSWRWNRDRCGIVLIAAWWSRSRRRYSDRGEVIAIISAMIVIAKNRMCDLRVMIAILSMKSRSQRLWTHRGLVIAIAARFSKVTSGDLQMLCSRSWCSNHDRGVVIAINLIKSRPQSQCH